MSAAGSDRVRLSAVVPAYSADALVARSVASVERAAASVDGKTEVIVVLNRNVSGLVQHAHTTILTCDENRGFAGGVMYGIRHASGEWIAVVNDDCVVDPDAFRAALAATTDVQVGAIAGLLVFEHAPGIVNSAGLDIDELGIATERLVGRPVEEAARQEVFGPTAAFAVYRRRMLDELGGLDESFFAYLEDADLAWRARMAGWRSVFEPAARATHLHSAAFGHGSSAKHFLVGRNRVRMLAKNATGEQLRRRAIAIALYDVAYVLYTFVRYRTPAALLGRLAGLRDWRGYRSLGEASRRPVRLSNPPGPLAALRRDRAYRSRGTA